MLYEVITIFVMFRSSYSAKLEKQQDKNLEKLIEKRAKLKEKLASFLSKDRTVTLKFSRSDPYIGFTETRHKFDVNGLEEKAAEKMAEKVLKNAEEKDYWCILSRNKGTSVCDYSGNMKELDGFEDIDRGTPVGINRITSYNVCYTKLLRNA